MTMRRSARPTVAFARSPGPKILPVAVEAQLLRIGPLTTMISAWPVVLCIRLVRAIPLASNASMTASTDREVLGLDSRP